MLFNSLPYLLVFLPVTVAGFFAAARHVGPKAALGALLVASCVFYGIWNPAQLPLLIGSIVLNHAVARAISTSGPARRARWAIAGVAGNLALLGTFKYAGFVGRNVAGVTGWDVPVPALALPLAISFFTFQQIGHLVDVWRGEATPGRLADHALFVAFFPQLIAGPIVRRDELVPQFARDETFRPCAANIGAGLTFLLLGLFKKAVLADALAPHADALFDGAANGAVPTLLEAWGGVLAYTFQLYFDFSGYCDMAIGAALLVNVRLPRNFLSPYKAVDIVDFWRRWHVTLSRFLRDYLYVPLGGNRGGAVRRGINLMLVMLLGGLWHGAGWTFVAWGALHGGFLIVAHGWRAASGGRCLPRGTGRALTLLAVVLAWVVFRAPTMETARAVWAGMAGLNGIALPERMAALVPWLPDFVARPEAMPMLAGGTLIGPAELAALLVLAALLCFGPRIDEAGPRLRLLALGAAGYFVVQTLFFASAPSEFLYFRF